MSSEQRPSLQGKKDLIRTYKTTIVNQKDESRGIVKRKKVAKDVFKILIAVLLSTTTLTSLLQLVGDETIYKYIIAGASIGSSIITSIYGVLGLESDIIKNSKIATECETLNLEIDRLLLSSSNINDAEIDELIKKIKNIINQTHVEVKIEQANDTVK